VTARRPRILVVEDNDALRENLAECLDGEGYQVSEARDGHAALALLEAGPLPDVVLIDMMMPGMGGTELVSRIRAEPRLAGLRLVLSTGMAPPSETVAADAVLTKPFGMAELLDSVRPGAPAAAAPVATPVTDRGEPA
jgi:CheY-like chemotaxis protein